MAWWGLAIRLSFLGIKFTIVGSRFGSIILDLFDFLPKPCFVYTDPLDEEVLEDGPWYADLFAQVKAEIGAEKVMKIMKPHHVI